jgi:hypothetical protein
VLLGHGDYAHSISRMVDGKGKNCFEGEEMNTYNFRISVRCVEKINMHNSKKKNHLELENTYSYC